jgi:hypothetical protein
MRAYWFKLRAEPGQPLIIQLPPDVPPGEVEVIILYPDVPESSARVVSSTEPSSELHEKPRDQDSRSDG